jgi:cobalt-zinc-cadmium efflux system outer membrane protein
MESHHDNPPNVSKTSRDSPKFGVQRLRQHEQTTRHMKFLGATLLIGFSAIHLATAANLSEADVIRAVLADNPEIKSARARWHAMGKRIPQEQAWDDLMVGADFERQDTSLSDFAGVEYMLSQTIPLSGKNRSRGRIAQSEVEAAFHELRRTELDILNRARIAFINFAAAHAQREITAQNEDLLRQFTKITQAKFEAGLRNQADVLMAEVELARLALTRSDQELEISTRTSELNVLMNRDPGKPLDTPSPLTFRDAVQVAEINTPEIDRALSMQAAGQARLQLAKRQWMPDPQFRIEARQMREDRGSGIDELDTGIFFSIPLFNHRKISSAIEEARHNLAAATHELEAARLEAGGLLRAQWETIAKAKQNYVLFRDKIIPLARQTVESTRADYEANRASFLDLITARRALQDAESMAVDQLKAHQIALAEYDRILGLNKVFTDSKNNPTKSN